MHVPNIIQDVLLELEAAGNYYTKGLMETLMAQSFYNPHIANVVSALATGTDCEAKPGQVFF